MDKRSAHLKVIKIHRKAVRKMCFKMGIFWRGIKHDLSKFSKEEMAIAEWYIGTYSPHDVCRSKKGYSISWIYHYHKNDHHWEYWLDFNRGYLDNGKFIITPVAIKMPYNAVIEMFCDFIGAGKAYNKDTWTPSMPLDYHLAHIDTKLYHIDTSILFMTLLNKLKELNSEDEFVKWYKINRKELKNAYENV